MKKIMGKLYICFEALIASAALMIRLYPFKVGGASGSLYGLWRDNVFPETLLPCCAFALMLIALIYCPKRKAATRVCGFICAAITTSMSMFAQGNYDLSVYKAAVPCMFILLKLVGSTVVFTCVCAYAFKLLDSCASESTQKSQLKYAIIILACWLPYLLLVFPGILFGDANDQIAQVLGTLYPGTVTSYTADAAVLRDETVLINSTNPILHTLLFGGLFALCQLLGNSSAAIFIFVSIQAILAALCMSRSLVLLAKIGLKKAALTALLTFYALFPIFPVYMLATMKDAAFALALFAFLLFVLELYIFPDETLDRPLRLIGGGVIICLMALLRSFGAYIAIFTLPFVFVSILKHGKERFVRGLCALIIPLCVYALVNYGVYPLLKFGEGPSSESKSLMFQQTALYLKEYPDDVTEDEKQAISEVLDYDTIADSFWAGFSDPVKYSALEYRGDYKAYTKAWLSMFKRHPGVYVRAASSMFCEYWNLEGLKADTGIKLYLGSNYTSEEDGVKEGMPIGETKVTPPVKSQARITLEEYAKSAIKTLSTLPPVSLLFTTALYLYALIMLVFYMSNRSKRGMFVPLIMLIYGICLGFGAVTGSTRYGFALYLCVPFICLMGAALPAKNKKNP